MFPTTHRFLLVVAVFIGLCLAPLWAAAEQPLTAGWLGVELSDITEEDLGTLNLSSTRGAKITHVVLGSPASRVGLRTDDIILKIDNVETTGAMQTESKLSNHPPSTRVQLTIYRDQRALRYYVRLAAPPKQVTDVRQFNSLFDRIPDIKDPAERIAAAKAALSLDETIHRQRADGAHQRMRAELWYQIGSAYRELPEPARTEGIEFAIYAFQSALKVWTRELDATDWAVAKARIGISYARRIEGERRENLSSAIDHLTDAVSILTKSEHGDFAVTAYSELGIAYLELATELGVASGSARGPLRNAIQALELALSVASEQENRKRWIGIHHALGDANRHLAGEEARDYFQRSIGHYNAALAALSIADHPEVWAEIHTGLAKAYIYDVGVKPIQYDKAIDSLRKALSIVSAESNPTEWSNLQQLLAEALLESKSGDPKANIKHAIDAYNAALTVRKRELNPKRWSLLQYSIARAYKMRSDGDRNENIVRAIAAYEAALSATLQDSDPFHWREIAIGLADALSQVQSENRKGSIVRAVTILEDLLRGLAFETDPEQWKTAHFMLGKLCLDDVHEGASEPPEKALAAFELLHVRLSKESDPLTWAGSQAFKATAYRQRLFGDRRTNLSKAIEAYEAALSIDTRQSQPTEWAALLTEYGGALRERRSSAHDDMKKSSQAFALALDVFTRDAFPAQWAAVQSLIAAGFLEDGRSGNGTAHKAAISLMGEITASLDQNKYPRAWAEAQLNLAGAFLDLPYDSYIEKHAQVISSVLSSLSIYSLASHPLDYLRANKILATAYMRVEEWNAAWASFVEARRGFVAAIGKTPIASGSTGYALERAKSLFHDAAFVAIKRHDLDAAWSWLNYGKAFGLEAELLGRASSLNKEASDDISVLKAKMKIWMIMLEHSEGDNRIKIAGEVAEWQNKISALLQKDNPSTSSLLSTIELLSEAEAVATPVITGQGGAIIIATHPRRTQDSCAEIVSSGPVDGSAQRPRLLAITNPAMSYDALSATLGINKHTGRSDGWTEGYLLQYAEGSARESGYERWLQTVQGIGSQLWQLFGGALTRALTCAGIKEGSRVLWMPGAQSGLLPIGLARAPDSSKSLIELYQLSHIISLGSATFAQARTKETFEASLGIVINPTGDLHYAELEGKTVTSYFGEARTKRFDSSNAEVSSVLTNIREASYWHFASHGKFDFLNPLASGLLLKDGSTLTVNQLIFRSQAIDRAPRLVFLSACETGLFDFSRQPEEFVGLPVAFMGYGVPSIISSLWQVDDRATMFIALKFYQLHVRQGLSPAAALRQSQLWLKNATWSELSREVYELSNAGALSPTEAALAVRSLHVGDQRGGNRFEVLWKLIAEKWSMTKKEVDTLQHNRDEERPFAHPYYWGGFVAHGF